MKEKKLNLFLFNFLAILYIEMVFRIVTIDHFLSISLIYVVLSSLMVSGAMYVICSLFNEKANRIIYRVLLFLFSFWAIAMTVYKKIFNVYFSLEMFKLADQVMDFWKDALGLIAKNIIFIIILLIPFIMTFILKKKISFQRRNRKYILVSETVESVSVYTQNGIS